MRWRIPFKIPHVHLPSPEIFGGLFGLIIALSIVSVVLQGVNVQNLRRQRDTLADRLTQETKALEDLKSQDQYLINKKLEEEIQNIQNTYLQAVKTYEHLIALREVTKETKTHDERFVDTLIMLSNRNYASAAASLAALQQAIDQTQVKLVRTAQTVQAPASNTAPTSGFSRQTVKTEVGDFVVDIVSADLSSTRVIVDTAADSDCSRDCPVLPLADYVSRNGAYAGVNGSYFCPAEYPSCAEKKNSFDTLLMNKNKVYFNSDNNVYSTVPAVIFLGGSVRFVGRSLEWGRDTSPDGVIANRPLLVLGSTVTFSGEGEQKEGNKGNRSFVAHKGPIVSIGVVHSASVAESAKTLASLGMENAINLDDGGSTALWFNGYKVGPGRNIPNAILFIRK